MKAIKIAASVLSADFARLGDEVAKAEQAGVDWIHVDVMDGRFVPNLTFGSLVVEVARRSASLPVDAHLMVEAPERLLPAFADAGAARVTVHAEVCPHLHRVVEQMRSLGIAPGVAVNPATPVEALWEIVPYVDLVLVMTVNPGFGGQSYIPTMTEKVRRVRRLLDERGRDGVELQVDGGIAPATAAAAVGAGAGVLVAGSAVFGGSRAVAENVQALRAAANE